MATGGREYRIFLGLAELFRTAVPPRVQESIACFEAALSVTPPNDEARVRRDAAVLLLQQLGDKAGAKRHLEQAVQVPNSGEVQCDVIYHLARLYQEEGNSSVAESLLRKGLNALRGFPNFHFRLLFQLADLLSYRGDYIGVATLLSNGAQYAAQTGTQHSQVLLLLNQAKCLILSCQYSEAKHTLDVCGQLVRNCAGRDGHQLIAFHLTFVVIYLLELGHVKEARVPLKELQNTVKLMTKKPKAGPGDVAGGEILEWISNEHLFVLVYLVCTLHSLLSGSSEKATSYAARALALIDQDTSGNALLVKLKASVLENVVVCRLVQGQFSAAIQEIESIIVLCNTFSSMMKSHQPIIHTLLGLYSMACGSLESANSQFTMALQTADAGLQIFVWLNQALVSLSAGNHAQFRTILESIAGSSLPESSVSFKSAVRFVRGVHCLLADKQTEAKHYLRDSLVLANEHDLNRLTTSVLLLLGQLFLAFGSIKEACDMIMPAFQLASKIPDMHLQVWAARQMTDLYCGLKDQTKTVEARDSHSRFFQVLSSEKARAQQSKQHLLTHWTGGPVENCILLSTDQKRRQSPRKRHHADEDLLFQYPKRINSDGQLLMQESLPAYSGHAYPHMSQGLATVSIPSLSMVHSKLPQQKQGHSVENLLAYSDNASSIQLRSRPLTHFGESLVQPRTQAYTRSQTELGSHTQPSYPYHSLPQSAVIPQSTGIPPQFQLIAQSTPQQMMQQHHNPTVFGHHATLQSGALHPPYGHPQYRYNHQ